MPGVDRALLAEMPGPGGPGRSARGHPNARRERSTTRACMTSSRRCCAIRRARAGHALDRVFYLSTSPEFFPLITGKIGAGGLTATARPRRGS